MTSSAKNLDTGNRLTSILPIHLATPLAVPFTPQTEPSQSRNETDKPQAGPLVALSIKEENGNDGLYSQFRKSPLIWIYHRVLFCYIWAFRERFRVEGSVERDESAFRDLFAYVVLLFRPVAWRSYFKGFFDDLGLSRDELRADAGKAYTRPFDPLENPMYEPHFPTPQMAMWKRLVGRIERHCKIVSAMCTIVVAIMTALLQEQSTKTYGDSLWYLTVLTLMLAGFSLLVSCEIFVRFGEVTTNPFNIYMWYSLLDARVIQGTIWNEWNMLSLPSVYLLWAIIIEFIIGFEMLKAPAANPEPASLTTRTFMRLLLGVVFVFGTSSWMATRRTLDFYANKVSARQFAKHCRDEEPERVDNLKAKTRKTRNVALQTQLLVPPKVELQSAGGD